MKDDRLEREMSLNLDGRLSSTRREQLLQHIEQDDEAARLWDEMERAQQLALSLPEQQVGPTFTETLWQRIRAGEGTPEAVFRDPVSPWTKARYLLTGAAAAAAVLIAVQALRPPREAAPAGEAVARAEVAERAVDDRRTTDPNGATTPLAQLQPRYSGAPQLLPVGPMSIAQASQVNCFDALTELQRRIPEVERSLQEARPAELVVRVAPELERVRGSTHLMRWMQRERIISLPGEFEATLALTERAVNRLQRAHDEDEPQVLRFAVESLRELDPNPLRERFEVICCQDPRDFVMRLVQELRDHPYASRTLHILPTDDPPLGASMQFRIGPLDEGWQGAFILLDGRQLPIDVDASPGDGSTGLSIRVERRDTEAGPLQDPGRPERGIELLRSRKND
ncbi:MAG: hypothetical protein IPM29_10040 [Planctomycetes bacterium]|nr:hypothetical protein [Planctomycetota bacterium]